MWVACVGGAGGGHSSGRASGAAAAHAADAAKPLVADEAEEEEAEEEIDESEALAALYAQGGIARFYQGMGAALLQAPLSRFGDTAAYAGMTALLESVDYLPPSLKTLCASVAAALFRIGGHSTLFGLARRLTCEGKESD